MPQVQCRRCGLEIPDTNAIIAIDGTVFCSEGCATWGMYFPCSNCGEYDRWTMMLHSDNEHQFCAEACMHEAGFIHCANCGRVVDAVDGDWELSANNEVLCRRCAERDFLKQHVHSYDYKTRMRFYSVGREAWLEKPGLLYMGVELEVDGGRSKRELVAKLMGTNDKRFYFKNDGSLDYGFEVVTHPATLAYHQQFMPWDWITQCALETGFKSERTGTCGLHVHVNRSFFGDSDVEQDLHIAKALLLMNRFYDSHVVPFSRRDYKQINEYAAKNDFVAWVHEGEQRVGQKVAEKSHIGHDARYQAINIQNKNTIEFRVFRGTLDVPTIIATLQFVDTFCRFAKKIDLREIDSTKWSDIFEGCVHAELLEYLSKRTDFDERKVVAVLRKDPRIERVLSGGGTWDDARRHSLHTGDVVRIRDWDGMLNEFGSQYADNSVIDITPCFTQFMRFLCGAIGTISDKWFDDGYDAYVYEFTPMESINESEYHFAAEMMEVFVCA